MCSSSASWKHFRVTLLIGTVTMGLPFSWSRRNRKVILSWQGKSRMLAVVLILVLYVVYLVYFVVRDLKSNGHDIETVEDILVRYVYMMASLMAIILYGNLWHFLELYVSYINEWIRLYNYIEETYIRKDMRPWKLDCDLIVQLFSAAYIIIPSMQVYHFMKFPESKMYGYWVVKGTSLEKVTYVSHILIIFGGIFTCICAALFHAHIYLIPISVCFQTLRECRPSASYFQSFPTTNTKLRETKNALKVYRGFYLNFHLGNQCINNVLYCFQSVATTAFVGCNCFLIRLGGNLNTEISFVLFAFSLFGTLLWLILLQAAGLTHKRTSTWVKAWKRQWFPRKERSYCKKVAISLSPVTVDLSGLYKITLLRVVKYVHIVMRGTIKGVLVLFIKY